MITVRSSVMVLVGAYSLLLSYSGAWAWQANINSGWASAVVVDGAGNVIAAGSTNNGTGSAFTVIKYNGVTGAEIWRRVISGTDPDRFDSANAVTLDGFGNVVAAGVTNSGCVAGWDCELVFGDFIVIKFSGADGAEQWRQVIGSASNSFGSATYNSANAVAVDRAGNVVAAGASSSSLGDFTVIKFNGVNGAELWRQVITGSVSVGDCADSANAVTVDGAGNVVTSGFLCNLTFPGPLEFISTIIKFNGVTGQELWRQANTSVASGAVAVDAAGNVVTAGSISNSGTFTSAFTTIKFDGATGQELWRQVINGTANAAGSNNIARAVGIDAQGNVVAAGFTTNNGTGRDFTVLKFDGAIGAELWRQGIKDTDGNGNLFDRPEARVLAIDFQGNVVAAGSTNNGTNSAFTAIKFNGATGAELWRQVITGAGAPGSANAVAVDARGNVVAAGSISNNFTVVSLDPGVGITVTPSSGSGSFQIFSFNFLNAKGFANIFSAQLLIHSSLTGAGGCYLYYHRESNAVWLQDDSGSGWIGPSVLGSGPTLQNSQCTLGVGSSSAFGSGSNLTLNLALGFTSAFSGNKKVYAFAYDNQGLTSDWQQTGTWTVPGGNQPPAVLSLAPSSGSGSSQTFSFGFFDPNGFTNVFSAQLLIHSTLAIPGSCYLYYHRESNGVWLQNDTGSGWIGPSLLGSGAVLQNSQCTVNVASSSAFGSGNQLTLNLDLGFTSAFSGGRNVYAFVYDNQGLTSDWQQRGTWAVP